MEIFIYIIVGIIWLIVSLVSFVVKKAKLQENQTVRKEQHKPKASRNEHNQQKAQKQKITKKVVIEEDGDRLFRDLQNNINELKNTINIEDDYSKTKTEKNKKIVSNDKEDNVVVANYRTDNRKHVNNMLSSLDIKNAIIYNAILEPKRIRYKINK